MLSEKEKAIKAKEKEKAIKAKAKAKEKAIKAKEKAKAIKVKEKEKAIKVKIGANGGGGWGFNLGNNDTQSDNTEDEYYEMLPPQEQVSPPSLTKEQAKTHREKAEGKENSLRNTYTCDEKIKELEITAEKLLAVTDIIANKLKLQTDATDEIKDSIRELIQNFSYVVTEFNNLPGTYTPMHITYCITPIGIKLFNIKKNIILLLNKFVIFKYFDNTKMRDLKTLLNSDEDYNTVIKLEVKGPKMLLRW
jgi:hypothetical protein